MSQTFTVIVGETKKLIKANLDMSLSQIRIKLKYPDFIFVNQEGSDIDNEYEEDFTISDIYNKVGNILYMKLKQQQIASTPQTNIPLRIDKAQHIQELNDVQQQINKDRHKMNNQYEQQNAQEYFKEKPSVSKHINKNINNKEQYNQSNYNFKQQECFGQQEQQIEANQGNVQDKGQNFNICTGASLDPLKQHEIYQKMIRQPIEGCQKYDKINDLDVYLYPRFTKNSMKELSKVKVILVVGQTGSGKSTMLDAMVNYLEDVPMDASFRYKLVDKKQIQNNQFNSLTDSVTSYYIKGKRDYPVQLIDTPSFMDNRGVSRDLQITQDISNFLQTQIDEINAVCIVSISSNVRLTSSLKYVYNSLLEIFGKDIKENITNLFTFSDGGEPLIKYAIKEIGIPIDYCYQFNNSAGYKKSTDIFSKIYWDIGYKSFQQFFDDLKYKFKSNSLTLTKEVIKERQNLNLNIYQIQPMIDKSLIQLETVKQQMIYLNQHQDDINKNKLFKCNFKFQTCKKVSQPAGIYGIYCFTCNSNCYYISANSETYDILNCSAMKDGKCFNCPLKCDWKHHQIFPYTFEFSLLLQDINNEDLHKKCVKTNYALFASQQIICALSEKYDEIEKQLCNDVQTLQKSLKIIQGFAFHPNWYSKIEIIDLMIDTEKNNQQKGFNQRIVQLEDQKKRNLLLSDLQKNNKEVVVDNILRDFKNTLEQLKNKKQSNII